MAFSLLLALLKCKKPKGFVAMTSSFGGDKQLGCVALLCGVPIPFRLKESSVNFVCRQKILFLPLDLPGKRLE